MSTNAEKNDSIKLKAGLDLLEDFPPPSPGQWRKEAEASLKDTTFEKALITRTIEGIDLQPIYTREDIEHLPHLCEKPGFGAGLRGVRADGYLATPWEICQTTFEPLPEGFNRRVVHDLGRGQTAVQLNPDLATRLGFDPDLAAHGQVGCEGVSLAHLDDFSAALQGLDLEKNPLHIPAGFSGLNMLMALVAWLKKENKTISAIKGSIGADPLAWLAFRGEMPMSLEKACDHMAQTVAWASKCTPHFKTVGISMLPYHNAGASAVQELAWMLATAADYINALLDRKLLINDIASQTRVTLGVNAFMFMEIAKIRAARILWSKLIAAYGGDAEARKITLHGVCSFYNQSKLDPWVNMLRTATEAFSAISAGVDSLETNPYDLVFGAPDEFSTRVARNTQILLKEESHLDRLIDPAGGSYFVEKLTAQLAEKAWKQFQDVMAKGGMYAALCAGAPQKETEETALLREKDLAKRKTQMVGVNFSANVREVIPADKTPDYTALFEERAAVLRRRRSTGNRETARALLDELKQPGIDDVVKTGAEALMAGATFGEMHSVLAEGAAAIQPINGRRASEIFETLRLAVKNHEEKTRLRPRVFLAAMGSVKQHKPRADFSLGFFEIAGFDVICPQGFDTPEQAVTAALEAEAQTVVICSSDDTYPELVPPLVRGVRAKKPETVFVLAGRPAEQVEAHKATGIDLFIYMGCDVRQTLSDLLIKTGVTA